MERSSTEYTVRRYFNYKGVGPEVFVIATRTSDKDEAMKVANDIIKEGLKAVVMKKVVTVDEVEIPIN